MLNFYLISWFLMVWLCMARWALWSVTLGRPQRRLYRLDHVNNSEYISRIHACMQLGLLPPRLRLGKLRMYLRFFFFFASTYVLTLSQPSVVLVGDRIISCTSLPWGQRIWPFVALSHMPQFKSFFPTCLKSANFLRRRPHVHISLPSSHTPKRNGPMVSTLSMFFS